MKHSTQQSSAESIGKRNPGFAPIRRGLLEHWPEMSVNARSLYIWLHLKANFMEPKRGWVEASFDDMAHGNGWSLKTLQRTIEELEAKPYIEVERAANQYALTRVRILKYDPEGFTSAVDKSDQSSTVGVDCAVDSAAVKFVHTTVHSKTASPQNQQDLQAPKNAVEVKNEKNGKSDAVRRPFDTELRLSNPSIKSASRFRKNQNLSARLAAKIQKSGYTFSEWVKVCKQHGWSHPLDAEMDQSFEAMQYDPDLESPLLSTDFIHAVREVWEDNREKNLPAGILCTKVIDYCDRERKSHKTLGDEDPGFYYPPDFVDHRNKLRARERMAEQQSGKSAEVRA